MLILFLWYKIYFALTYSCKNALEILQTAQGWWITCCLSLFLASSEGWCSSTQSPFRFGSTRRDGQRGSDRGRGGRMRSRWLWSKLEIKQIHLNIESYYIFGKGTYGHLGCIKCKKLISAWSKWSKELTQNSFWVIDCNSMRWTGKSKGGNFICLHESKSKRKSILLCWSFEQLSKSPLVSKICSLTWWHVASCNLGHAWHQIGTNCIEARLEHLRD